MRLNIKMMMLSMLASAMFVGCGGSNTTPADNNRSSNTPVDNNVSSSQTVEIAGPGGAFAGATAFTQEMVAGQSIYHPFSGVEEDGTLDIGWIRVTFEANGDLLFNGEIDGSYTIVDGQILVSNTEGDFTIKLNTARTTEWDVTFVEHNETKTWLLELKYNANLLVGKKFSVPFDSITTGEYLADGTAKGYDAAGNLVETITYAITNGVLIHRSTEDADERFLMKVEADGSLLAWHPVEEEADLFTVVK